jgi:hypothetical protein
LPFFSEALGDSSPFVTFDEEATAFEKYAAFSAAFFSFFSLLRSLRSSSVSGTTKAING